MYPALLVLIMRLYKRVSVHPLVGPSIRGSIMLSFLDASSHLYNWVCPSVGPSVGPLVTQTEIDPFFSDLGCKHFHR